MWALVTDQARNRLLRTHYDRFDGSRATDWRSRAACRTTGSELFFPHGDPKRAVAQRREAKRICESCAIQATCFLWGTTTGIGYGICSGTTEQERRSADKSRQRQQRADGQAHL